MNSSTEHLIALQRRLQAEKARRGLLSFTAFTFPGYEVNWHHRLLCDHVDKLVAGQITRLIVFMPPRHGKSEIVSRRLPAYFLGRFPKAEVIAASYSQELIDSMSRAARGIMASPEYAEVFPAVAVSDIRAAVQEWHTTGGGIYKCAGVGGGITGRGFDLGIIDDPVKDREEAESQRVRDAVYNWFTSTFYTRRYPDSRILVTLTRWHQDDLAGRLLDLGRRDPKADQWTVLSLPALAEDGTALWPERFSADELERTRANVGAYDWQALYQQQPQPAGGARIKRHWFKVVLQAPQGLRWMRFWDLAVSTRASADYTASCAQAIDSDGNLFIRDMVRGRWEWPDTRKIFKQTALNGGGAREHGIEEAGQQKGFIDDLKRDPELAGVAIRAIKPDKDKLTRALPWIARAEAGKVFLVEGSWVNEFLNEAQSFTGAGDKHDDQIDAVSGGYQMLSAPGTGLLDYYAQLAAEKEREKLNG